MGGPTGTPGRRATSDDATHDPLAVGEAGPVEGVEFEGIVIEVLPQALYRVEVGPGDQLLAHLSRDVRRNFVRILKGDRVSVRRAARNRTRGRIMGRR